MTKLAAHRCALVTISAALACGCNDGGKIRTLQIQLEAQQKEIQELKAKLSSVSRSEALDLDEKCAKQALAEFHAAGYRNGGFDSFTNHYDAALGKCFILVQELPHPSLGALRLSDAYERKIYAELAWRSDAPAIIALVDPTKKYWQVKPFECHVLMPSGEKKICESGDEFDELVKTYMGGSGARAAK